MGIMKVEILPHDLETERLVLSETAWNPEQLERLQEGHFFSPMHRKIFETIFYLKQQGLGTDIVSINEVFKKSGEFEIFGGLKRLNDWFECASQFTGGAYLKENFEVLESYRVRREIILLAQSLESRARLEVDASAVGTTGVKQLSAILNGTSKPIESQVLRDVLLQNLADLEKQEKEVQGWTTGLEDLDQLTGQWKFGHFDIIAGRPSMGKTSLALFFARACAKQNLSSLFISLEMDKESLSNNLLAIEAQVDIEKLENAKNLSGDEWDKLIPASGRVADYPIWFDDSSRTPAKIIESIQQHVLKNWVKVVFLDYIQMASYGDGKQNLTEKIGRFAYALQGLAKELKISVVVLAQLNRNIESRKEGEPFLSDLKDSGALEQAAYKVLMIHREDFYDEGSEHRGTASLLLRKNKRGRTGRARVKFMGEFGAFENFAKREEPMYQFGQPKKYFEKGGRDGYS